eukprot:TRINITY_DN5983_c0_g2_i1.p1 TRINITY_DN5983_c0_g2~~TRINITY_DN5983_c0_g2_i1.p1  ORF type:complete len:708 (-),score=183.57 TRINITY_DN5983_c0_g2_i1:324-2447(-)
MQRWMQCAGREEQGSLLVEQKLTQMQATIADIESWRSKVDVNLSDEAVMLAEIDSWRSTVDVRLSDQSVVQMQTKIVDIESWKSTIDDKLSDIERTLEEFRTSFRTQTSSGILEDTQEKNTLLAHRQQWDELYTSTRDVAFGIQRRLVFAEGELNVVPDLELAELVCESVRSLQDCMASHGEHISQHASQASAAQAAQLHGSLKLLETLLNELATLSKAAHSRAMVKAPSVNLEDLRTVEREVQDIKATAAIALESQSALKELRADMEALKATAAATSALQALVQDLGKDVEGVKQHISGKTPNGQKAIKELRRMVERFQDEIAALQVPHQEDRRLFESLRVQLDRQLDGLKVSAAETARVDSSVESLRNELQKLRTSVAENAAMCSSLGSLQVELECIKTSTAGHAKLGTCVEGLKEELDGLKASAAGTEKLSSSLESLRNDVESLKPLAGDQAKLGGVRDMKVSAEDHAKLMSSVRSLQDEMESVRELRAEVEAIKASAAPSPEMHASAQDLGNNGVASIQTQLLDLRQELRAAAQQDKELQANLKEKLLVEMRPELRRSLTDELSQLLSSLGERDKWGANGASRTPEPLSPFGDELEHRVESRLEEMARQLRKDFQGVEVPGRKAASIASISRGVEMTMNEALRSPGNHAFSEGTLSGGLSNSERRDEILNGTWQSLRQAGDPENSPMSKSSLLEDVRRRLRQA